MLESMLKHTFGCSSPPLLIALTELICIGCRDAYSFTHYYDVVLLLLRLHCYACVDWSPISLYSFFTFSCSPTSTATYAFCLSMLFWIHSYNKKNCFTHGFYIYSKQTNDSQFFFFSYILLHLCLCLCFCLCSIIYYTLSTHKLFLLFACKSIVNDLFAFHEFADIFGAAMLVSIYCSSCSFSVSS